MSTPEQPAAPALTRKQMRELRDTGSNPIVSAPAEPEADSTPTPPPLPAPPVMPPSAVAPLPRAADPVVVAEPPVPDAAVDLGVSPLTRRQARQQERIRTASVPVITPELAAAQSASVAAAASTSSVTAVPAPTPVAVAAVTVPNDERPEASLRDLFGLPATTEVDVVAESPADPWSRSGEVPVVLEVDEEPAAEAAPEVAAEPEAEAEAEPEAERATVNPMFGAGLLAAEPAPVDLSPSFDQLLGRSAGTGGTPHALIVPQSSAAGPIVAPVSSTGEVLVTGTLNLPEGLGSNGHAPGADGKAIDASLVDGEIPAHSSPTPIAASAAISTVKTPGEIIKPPAPEKGSKLMMTLAITAGVLALALVGVLILAFVTGVF